MIHKIKRKCRSYIDSVIAQSKKPSNSDLKLHLGCGNKKAPNWCNVDIAYSDAVDVIDDIKVLRKFKSNFATNIYSCHVLEHFSHEECKIVLKRWLEVLQPGGEIRISVPDLDRIVKQYNNNWEHFQTSGNSPWIGLIFGGQRSEYDFHKTGFNFCWLKYLMEEVGFEDIKEYPHHPHFIDGFYDASLANDPFKEYLSLNIVAKKPSC